MMTKTRFIICTLAMCLIATPAMADLILDYHVNNTYLSYTASTNQLTITDNVGSTLDLYKMDTATLTTIDSARISDPLNFNFVLDLTMVDGVPNDNTWSGSGTMNFTDTSLSSRVAATVLTTMVDISPVVGGSQLTITGTLGALNPPSILVGGDPWTFQGTGEGHINDEDGIANHVTMYNASSYDSGYVFVIRTSLPSSLTMDQFLSTDRSGISAVEIKGSIVPVPGAILLGALGLGVAGVKLRRFA